MFGFFVGAMSLFGLIAVVRGRRFQRGGFGPHFGPRVMFRRMFERLDTTPGQEKVIVEAFGDLRQRANVARSELVGARTDVAEALRQESFDEVLLGNVLTRLDDSVDAMRKAALDAFGKVHAALDERQRNILADLVERGRGRGANAFAHPYRL